MKILAIGRNYVEHIAELKNEVPDEPVIFFKPDTAILRHNEPFYYPEYTNDVHHEAELILRVCREGKNIDTKFAQKYYDGIGLGIDFTARDLQAKAKAKGLPWTLAKGFNGSAPVSEFLPLNQFPDLQDINFRLDVNGETKQQGNSKMMLHPFDAIIAYISRFITLKTGDIIFTGTPAGVGPVKIGDRLEGYVEDKKLLDFEVK
ncbi:2-keto-4-pentenoate hydratase/2-oxohepta-3-ene-1,7-dioic acid hydratase in catechol pathway [Pontibacter ummariensis]|uniref:2-keto-4-pentenoate hydratase/2-oxohepta-3-ene-1,7-dioic acid hydratase (Catechol pathway) n=1 Tax=Pontibacter ummariensis TaxID=1610492 RepID=A0A239J830_9BACT|nr:fumarylacetoacetate hydrolase family protein [Pontibacter ummariensis]PRY08919.1 2-keto-4-pentenoate hydratase/2-oxohepta-3-ene-1,7-dioic acid hydratase in catechol pathway [Pontibacter ummariensis]SNT01812.1 2-keto-4-pentenoate hydratase/2-oxohepta-3-ene-1,7-dioic acid hydratase (catechol pathway) [Pontibacter ummariensis]